MFFLGETNISKYTSIFCGINNVTLEITGNEKFRKHFVNFRNSAIFSRVFSLLNTYEQQPNDV